ncbi:hypothetical protein TNIN_252501 [Trichonephila inaurata madagascariensis]|uniref:Uncharacterized protein n=1 Tax=Trichonephila inaurata madagascariensis TaxID=2747483 RepID=A0A8X6XDI7_9ARAC|nr:hypothetical protein TNIN_252501 [Trichonephila inaurata madagascariensis]
MGPETAELSRLIKSFCSLFKKGKKTSCSDKTFFLMGKTPCKRNNGLKMFPGLLPIKSNDLRWFADFKNWSYDTNDAESLQTGGNRYTGKMEEVTKIIMKDQSECEIAEMTQISYGSVFTILHEN